MRSESVTAHSTVFGYDVINHRLKDLGRVTEAKP